MTQQRLLSQLNQLRVADLKKCCQQLGLPSSGRKADLKNTLLVCMSNGSADNPQASVQQRFKATEAARVIAKVFQEVHTAKNHVNTSGAGRSDVEHIAAGSAAYPRAGMASGMAGTNNTRLQCICGVNYDRPPQVQCEACGVWQHCRCLGLLVPPSAGPFWCYRCRLMRADPFSEPHGDPVVNPRLIQAPQLTYPGQVAVGHVEVSFNVPSSELSLMKARPQDYQIWVWSFCITDTVPSRFLWPKDTELRINTAAYRVHARASTQKISNKTRDMPAIISTMLFPGSNTMSMTCKDPSPFIVAVQIMRRRPIARVMHMLKRKETLAEAVQRVQHTISGGTEGHDEDLVAISTTVSLRCPITGTRIGKPARFTNVSGLQAFDMDAFIDTAKRTRKWADPSSDQAGTILDLQEDAFLEHVLQRLQGHANVMEIEVSPEGHWRPRGGPEQPWQDPLGTHSTLVAKEEPGMHAVGPAGHAAGDTSEEEDEMAELRAAAAAVSSRKRKEPSPEYINLISDDDEPQPQQAPAQLTNLAAPGTAATSQQGPFRQGAPQQASVHPPPVPAGAAAPVPQPGQQGTVGNPKVKIKLKTTAGQGLGTPSGAPAAGPGTTFGSGLQQQLGSGHVNAHAAGAAFGGMNSPAKWGTGGTHGAPQGGPQGAPHSAHATSSVMQLNSQGQQQQMWPSSSLPASVRHLQQQLGNVSSGYANGWMSTAGVGQPTSGMMAMGSGYNQTAVQSSWSMHSAPGQKPGMMQTGGSFGNGLPANVQQSYSTAMQFNAPQAQGYSAGMQQWPQQRGALPGGAPGGHTGQWGVSGTQSSALQQQNGLGVGGVVHSFQANNGATVQHNASQQQPVGLTTIQRNADPFIDILNDVGANGKPQQVHGNARSVAYSHDELQDMAFPF